MFDFLDLFTLVCGGDVKTTAEAAVQEHDKNNDPAEATALEPVDAMNAKNYLIVNLSQPMGILLEENYNPQHGGAFVSEINEGCSAAADGSICRGDQVIAIGDKRVSGMDFDEVIKLIFDSVEMKIKLTLFRGPAESLYGPSGASKEWLDEFVAERGEEAALVEEESESEVMPDIADIAVSPALLDDVAVAAAAAVDAYALDDTAKADQVLVDSESCDEKEADAALEVENEVDGDEEVAGEAEVEKEDDAADQTVLIEDEVDADVQLAHETEVEKGVDTTVRAVLIEDDADSDEEVAVEADVEDEAEAAEDVSVVGNDEEVASEAELENEGDGTDEAVLVEDEADSEEQVECEAALETDAPILDGHVSKASKEWLDSYFANPESQLVSDDEMDEADTLGESAADLETRARKAAELKEAALAAVVEKDDSTNAKGILKEPRYSPKGVEELKHLEPSPAGTKKSFDDESAASSVWSEADDYIGQVVDEVPVKRVGSSLAAMGVASTLATAMILN